MWIAEQWQDYELLDCGGGEKLERWGEQYLVRPDPQAIWDSPRKNPAWKRANARYLRSQSGGGHWEKKTLPESWKIRYRDLTFQVKPMNFKHTGLFPEQAVNWDFAMEKIRNAGRPIRVLNLFAYTGGATVACARAGASVCHVDAAKGMVAWARENARLSGLGEAPIRWIVDDCGKFVEREIRRGKTYDAIIMDPPSYGRRGVEAGGQPLRLRQALRRGAVGQALVCAHQLLHHGPGPVGAGVSAASVGGGQIRRQVHLGRAGPAGDGDGPGSALRCHRPLVQRVRPWDGLRHTC